MQGFFLGRARRAGVVAFTAVFAGALITSVGMVGADEVSIDFESFSTGNPNGQSGWSKTGAYDAEIVADTGVPGFGTRTLRVSNSVTSGSFGDQLFSSSLADDAGELAPPAGDAESGGMSGGTRRPYYEGEFQFTSADRSGAEQPNLLLGVSPDRGDGARMSLLRLLDTPTGFEIRFFDYDTATGTFTTEPGTLVAGGLSRTAVHTVLIKMFFVEGPANDVVEIHVNGALALTGTSWEDYFRDNQPPGTRTVDSLLFRAFGTAQPGLAGDGFLFDNVRQFSGLTPAVGGIVVEQPAQAVAVDGLSFVG
jgi:hypothetical protein